jgi:type 1 glutamine amidotransferase
MVRLDFGIAVRDAHRMPDAVPLASPLIRTSFVTLVAAFLAGFGAPTFNDDSGAIATGRAQETTPVARERILLFSKTAGFRHQSIPDGIKAIRGLFEGRYEVDASEDSSVFNTENLKRYKAVVFVSTTGDILDEEQQKAFEAFIRAGGGYAGVHAAADTEHSWPWYGQLVGAYFKTHPKVQTSTVVVEDRSHRSTRMLPSHWQRTDEWYVYDKNPRGRVKVLASLDTSTVEGANMGSDHPIAWYHEFEGGRAWYTGGGHTSESFSEDLFLKHLEGGILWAASASDDAPPQSRPVDGTN